jgi:hypothetical protein
MTLRRLPDEDPQNLADPAYRRRRIILQNMKDEELAIAQVEEKQAIEAVLYGKYTMSGKHLSQLKWIWGAVPAITLSRRGGSMVWP